MRPLTAQDLVRRIEVFADSLMLAHRNAHRDNWLDAQAELYNAMFQLEDLCPCPPRADALLEELG